MSFDDKIKNIVSRLTDEEFEIYNSTKSKGRLYFLIKTNYSIIKCVYVNKNLKLDISEVVFISKLSKNSIKTINLIHDLTNSIELLENELFNILENDYD